MPDTGLQVAVVGGGIWGLSTAYHLVLKGASVRLLERNRDIAGETTPRAAGIIGQIRSSPTMCRAVQYALDLCGRLGAETGLDLGLRRPGSLQVALTPERMEAYGRQVELAVANGVDAAFVSDDEMLRLAPALDVARLLGGYFVAGDGYVDPRRCALAYAAAGQQRGVSLELNTRVTGLAIERDSIRGVHTENGLEEADAVVVTSGPWTDTLVRRNAYRLPVQAIRHQRVRTVPVAGIPAHHPVVRVTDVSCYVRPEQGGYLYGFFEPEPMPFDLENMPDNFSTDDLEPPVEVMSEARQLLSSTFPVLADLDIAERRQGLTTFAPDGRYLIGPVPEVKGLFAASGCAALGIAGSAAIGRWLAGWVVDGKPDDDLRDFDLLRFGDQAADRNWVRDESRRFYETYYDIH